MSRSFCEELVEIIVRIFPPNKDGNFLEKVLPSEGDFEDRFITVVNFLTALSDAGYLVCEVDEFQWEALPPGVDDNLYSVVISGAFLEEAT